MNRDSNWLKLVSVVLSGALILTAPGLEAYSAFAAGTVGAKQVGLSGRNVRAPGGGVVSLQVSDVSWQTPGIDPTAFNAIHAAALLQKPQDSGISFGRMGEDAVGWGLPGRMELVPDLKRAFGLLNPAEDDIGMVPDAPGKVRGQEAIQEGSRVDLGGIVGEVRDAVAEKDIGKQYVRVGKPYQNSVPLPAAVVFPGAVLRDSRPSGKMSLSGQKPGSASEGSSFGGADPAKPGAPGRPGDPGKPSVPRPGPLWSGFNFDFRYTEGISRYRRRILEQAFGKDRGKVIRFGRETLGIPEREEVTFKVYYFGWPASLPERGPESLIYYSIVALQKGSLLSYGAFGALVDSENQTVFQLIDDRLQKGSSKDSSSPRPRDGEKGMTRIKPLILFGVALTALAVAVPLSAANLTVSVGFGGLWLRDLAMLATVMAVMLAGIRWLDHQETSLVKGLSVRFFLLVLALGAGALVVRFIDWSWIAASGASLSWLGFPLAGLAWVAQNGSESDGQPESASPLLHDRIVEGLKKAGLNPEDFVTDIRKLLAPGAEKNILERGWKKEESSQAGLRVYSLGDAVTFKTGQRATYALNGLVYLTTFAGPVMQAIAVDSSGKVVFNEIHRLDRGEAGVAGEFTSDVQVKDQSSAASAQNRGSSGELIEVPVGSFLTLLVFVAWAGFLSLHPNPVLPTWVFVLFSLGVFFSGAVFSASVAFRAVRWFNRGFYKMLLRSRAPDDPLPSDEEIDNMNFKGWAVGAAIAAFFVGGYLGLSYFMYLFKSLFAAGP